jgi:aminomuconate-semialdehyde/2-hydroxymuconate-6-semialdehyde dehydrogenase
MEKIKNYINSEFADPANGRYLPNVAPARGEPYSQVPDSDAADVDRAVQAAAQAFSGWAALSSVKRAAYLRKFAARITELVDDLATAESRDSGKPVRTARDLDIPRSALNFSFFADVATQFHGESYLTSETPTRPSALNYTEYTPLGVVACISPWNLPLYLLTWKIAPALAAGNTVVAKPSELTPYTAFRLSQIANDIGLPPGVLNIIHGTGPGAGQALVSHPLVKAVSFTGSTVTGQKIAQITSANFKRTSLEMGGKNPNIIFADCDFERAVEMTVKSSFDNQGQICLCGSRIFVEKPIFERFKKALVEKTKALRVGNPADENTQQGALVSEGHMQKVLGYIDLAQKEGGTILCGGKRAELSGENKNGYFILPTLIEGLSSGCRTNQEEIFGPVATIMPFESEDEVLQMANSTRYGLSASVWTQNTERAHRVSRRLEAGVVWVNTWMLRDLRTPFGGVKDSGMGREGGFESLKFFSEVKNVCLATN